MQNDESGTERERFNAAARRLNAGEHIPEVDASLIEHSWEAMSGITREGRAHCTVGLGAIAAGNPDIQRIGPEQGVAVMARYMLLDALVERGIVDEYLGEESKRRKLFAGAASISCDKSDLGKVLVQKHLDELSPETAEKTREELRLAGCDLDRPRIAERFLRWMRERD